MPIDFPQANVTFQKPEGWTDEECMPLRCCLVKSQLEEEGKVITRQNIISCWQPNKDDVDAINRGEPIFLHLTSNIMPPVWLYTYNEKGEINESE